MPAQNANENEDENKFLLTEDRVNSANHILDLIKLKTPRLRAIIESMMNVCDAYIELVHTI